jgi:ribosomal protein S18 acetylase RimI-like enzyme
MLSIRPGTAGDLAQVAVLEIGPDTAMWLGETGLAWHERALADPDQEHLVADDDGRLAGFVLLAGLAGGGHAVELRRMAVDPARRGAGLGRLLLRAALARARDEHGARRVWLDVKAHNLRARALYESEGFTLTDTPAAEMVEADGTTSELVVMARPVR